MVNTGSSDGVVFMNDTTLRLTHLVATEPEDMSWGGTERCGNNNKAATINILSYLNVTLCDQSTLPATGLMLGLSRTV